MAPDTGKSYEEIRSQLGNWLQEYSDAKAYQWIKDTAEKLQSSPEDWILFTSFSAVPQHTGKDVIPFSDEELQKAGKLRKIWQPVNWSVDQLGRIFFILSFADQSKQEFLDKIEKIFVTSDLGEAVALYKGLPLYPYPDEFKERTAEG